MACGEADRHVHTVFPLLFLDTFLPNALVVCVNYLLTLRVVLLLLFLFCCVFVFFRVTR
jgi:hypothetical protein